MSVRNPGWLITVAIAGAILLITDTLFLKIIGGILFLAAFALALIPRK